MLIINDLKLVWQFMSTNLLGLEKVDFIRVLTHVEVPNTVYLSSEAMNWLISPYHKRLILKVRNRI